MARYAIGDVQGCYEELRELVDALHFTPDRDQLWFVGDLVNRGPKSLEVLRWVQSLGDAAVCVLGNHDLHLLALSLGASRTRTAGDTLDAILEAPDRRSLLAWLQARPLLHCSPHAGRAPAEGRPTLLVHAGILPLWSTEEALRLAGEVEQVLRTDPEYLFRNLYGNEPSQWSARLEGADRLRFTINVLTRMRFCTADGRIDLKMKGPPASPGATAPPGATASPGDQGSPWRPWFDVPPATPRCERIVCGHWSALGLLLRRDVASLDTGCIWGQTLTAIDLDSDRPPVSVSCRARAADWRLQ